MRLIKWPVRILVVVVVVAGVGWLLFGSDLGSYVRTGGKSVKSAVADSIPVEWELRRAKDMIEDLIPEMHANIRLVAQEEIEIEALEADTGRGRQALADQKAKICRLRAALEGQQVNLVFTGHAYTRDEVKADLARRLESCRNAEIHLAGKEKLLASRRRSLEAAVRNLEQMRMAKADLGNQVQALESQFRLVQAAAAHSTVQLDDSKLAQTRRLLGSIKKRLDVAQRVLEKEQRFVEAIPVNELTEQDLLAQVDEYLGQQAVADKTSVASSR